MGQFVIHGGLRIAQLIIPGIDVHTQPAEAKLFVHMLGAFIGQIGIQQDFLIAVFAEQRLDKQAQNDLSQPFVLHGSIADFDADLADARLDITVVHFTDQLSPIFDHVTVVFGVGIPDLCDDLFYSNTQSVGKACVRHHAAIVPPCAELFCIPNFDKLIATIRSREISASIILQSQSQLKTIYKDAADTIVGNCDSTLFLGGKEKSTLKEISELLGKETIDLVRPDRALSKVV